MIKIKKSRAGITGHRYRILEVGLFGYVFRAWRGGWEIEVPGVAPW